MAKKNRKAKKNSNLRTGMQSSLAKAVERTAQTIKDTPAAKRAQQTQRTQKINNNHKSANYSKNKDIQHGSNNRNTTSFRDAMEKYRPNENKIGKALKGGAQQSVGLYAKTVSSLYSGDPNKAGAGFATGSAAHRMGLDKKHERGSNDRRTAVQKIKDSQHNKKRDEYRKELGKKQVEGANIASAQSSKLREKGVKNVEVAKKGMSAGGKFAIDLLVAGEQLGIDAGIGALTGVGALPAMLTRSYGGAYDTAEKEGASKKQAMLYGVGVGGLEAATEKMFSVATPLRKLYGKGAGDALTDKVLKKMVGKATGNVGKNAAYHGGKIFLSALTEGLEEMVSDGLEPAVANQIYANATGTPHSTSAKDIFYSGAVGGAMGGLLGGAGQVVEYSQGKNVQEVFGTDGVKELAKKVMAADEDTGDNVKGAALNEMINTGEGIIPAQARELYNAARNQEARDMDNYDTMTKATNRIMQQSGYVEPAEKTAETFESGKEEITNAVKEDKELQLPELKVNEVAEAISAIRTGIANIDDINMFTTMNPEARTVYEKVTGETLPKTNRETRSVLMEKIALNRVESAKVETEYFKDKLKGVLQQDVTHTYGANGQEAFSAMVENVNVADGRNVEDSIVSFEHFYDGGRAGLVYSDISSNRNPAYENVPREIRKAAFEAGLRDREMAEDKAKGTQLILGKKIERNRSQGKNKAQKGKVISKLSVESRSKFTASEQKMFRMLARAFNINIHVVDEIEGTEANGYYVDGEMYLNVNADRALSYVFAHEITHHMERYAPEEYFKLKEHLRTKWTEEGGREEAIAEKINRYALHDVEIDSEQALDEILADSTYEMLRDEGFVEELCKTDRKLSQAVLEAIKNIIAKIRSILAEGDRFTPQQNEALLSNLGILKEMGRLWADGLAKSVDNRQAVGTTKENSEVQYSLMEFEDGKRFVVIDGDTSSFDGLSQREQGVLATKIIKERFVGKVVGLDNKVFVNGRGAGEYGFPMKKLEPNQHDAKMRASTELDNLFDAGFNFRNEADGKDGHIHPDVINGFDYFDTIFKIGLKYFQGTINIKNIKNGKLFKDVTKIKDVTEDISSSYGKNPKSTFLRTSSTDSIPKTKENSNKNAAKKRYSLTDNNVAMLTDERIEYLFSEYGASSPKYSQAYIAFINPKDYLKLTLSDSKLEKWNEAAKDGSDKEMYPLDTDILKDERQTPFLSISMTGKDSAIVDGHEGRHRMRALMEAGVTKVPVVLRDMATKNSKKKMAELSLEAQDFGDGPINGSATIKVENLIPINKVYADEVKESYGRGADIRYSLGDNTIIKKGMSDNERAAILQNKEIIINPYNPTKLAKDREAINRLENAIRKEAGKVLLPLARKLDVLKKGYTTNDIQIEFNYGRNNFDESTKKQAALKKTDKFISFAKMLSCFDEIIKSAALIEVHDDIHDVKTSNLRSVYVLISAFKDGNDIVPVKLIIKEFDGIDNVLYVSMTLSKIKEVALHGQRTQNKHNSPLATSITVNIAELLKNVNDDEIVKYAPNQLSPDLGGKRLSIKENSNKNAVKLTDSEGNTLSKEQHVMYHGTPAETDIAYDSLIKKPDMKIVKVTTALSDIMELKRKDIAKEAKSRLENKVGLDSENRTVVHNSDTDSDIIVGKPGIEHGLDRNYKDTAIVSMHLDEYLKNAIKINEVFPDTNRKHNSDVLLGYGENKFGEKIPAYFVISKLKTGKDELIEFGSLYSVRGKKIEDDSAQGSPGIQSRTSPIISISDLLDIVNEMYSDILPKSVAEHYENERKESKLGKDVRFSLNENFAQEVDDWFNNKRAFNEDRGFFRVGITSDVLKSIDVKDRDIIWYKSKIKKILNDHEEMSIDVIKEVPQVLENPIIVMQSKTRLNSITLLGELYADDMPVLVAIQLNPKNREGEVLNFAKIASAYGHSRIQGLIDSSDILYVNPDKEKTDTWLLAMNRLQLPLGLTKYGSIGTVTYYADNVNNDTSQNTTIAEAFEKAKQKRFSLPDEDSTFDYINQQETEFFEMTPVKDYEKDAKRVQVQSMGELQQQVEKLRNDKKLTHGKVLDKSTVRESMNGLVRTLMSFSEGTTKKTNHRLVDVATKNSARIFKAIKDGDVAEAANIAYYTASEIIENLDLINDDAFYEYKQLRDYLRTTRITISELDRSSIPDFAQFRKGQMNRIRIVNEGGIPVDTVYGELCDTYPELFGSDIEHPADQLLKIAEARDSLEPYDIILSTEETEQLIKRTAQDILDISAVGKPWKSWADKKKEYYDEKIKAMKAAQAEAKRDIKIAERMRATRMVGREKSKSKEKNEKQKSRREHVKSFGSIYKNYKWLSDRLVKPTDDKHIPEGFRTELARLLQQIDLQTERSKKLQDKYGEAQKTFQMNKLRSRLEEIAAEDGSGVFEYDGQVFNIIKALEERLDGRGIDQMSNADLKNIDILLKSIKRNMEIYNKAINERIKETTAELGESTMRRAAELVEKRGRHKNGLTAPVHKLTGESMVKPREFFEEIGGGLHTTYMGMREGFDKHIDNITMAREYLGGLFKEHNKKTLIRKHDKPGSEIEEWRRGGKEFTLQGGGAIKLSPSQVMSLYCLRKRDQAMGHIMGAGVVATEVDAMSKIKRFFGAKAIQEGFIANQLSVEDVDTIISSLDIKQVEIADGLMKFMNTTCADWGNETSMLLNGYRKFTEEDYFPIKSKAEYLDSHYTEKGKQSNKKIKNPGFSKAVVVNASNPIVIDDIFDVVAEHINDMSLYNALAVPIRDFEAVWNYKRREEDGKTPGVKAQLGQAWGTRVNNYVDNFLKDLNGMSMARSESARNFLVKSLGIYKKSAIAANLRVALQQPTALVRAYMILNPAYSLGINHVPIYGTYKHLKDMKKHCQVARWKSWGFSQTDVARDMEDIMMNKEWTKIDVLTMKIYGSLDNVTWSKIWAAVRVEIKHKHKDVKVNSEEFYKLCNERASEIFDKTQVVDSVFHRSQMMRSEDSGAKIVTSFMAEPATTFNMVRSGLIEANELRRDGNTGKAILKANRALSVYVINAAAVSAAAAVADSLRGRAPDDDDEDDVSWFTNAVYNFWDNINPVNMIPILKDVWGFKDGWGTSNMALEGWASLVESTVDLVETFTGNSDKELTEVSKGFAEAIGFVTGLPIKNVIREVDTIFKVFGIDVFAGETGVDDGKEKTLFDRALTALLDKIGFESSGNKGVAGYDKDDKNYYGIYAEQGVGLWDKLTDKTKAEMKKEAFDERVNKIKGDVDGLHGSMRDEAIWKAVTENYTNYIADGELGTLREMRKTFEAVGGDMEKFDKAVRGKIEGAYKKNIGDNGDSSLMNQYREYLMDNYDYTEAKISNQVVKKSDTAKEFQKQLCLGDEDKAVDALTDLIQAGITYEDAYALYLKRADGIEASNYSSGELLAPVTGTVTSGFGYRNAPTAGATTEHYGIDIAAAAGTDVAAADGGQVTKVDFNSSRGCYIEVTHGNGRKTRYQHLSGYYIDVGDVVTKGQRIGAVGSTGVSTGPHLHFEVMEGGKYVNPATYLY